MNLQVSTHAHSSVLAHLVARGMPILTVTSSATKVKFTVRISYTVVFHQNY